MRGVDTNVLVRFLTQDDPEQARRVDSFFARLERAGESAHVSAVVLCELAWVLRSLYGLKREEIQRALETLLEADRLEIEARGIVHRAVALYGGGSGDFADYMIGLRNRQAGCQDTVTLDRRLGQSDLFTLL
jgi:predicted nucleic-acid-binding protein